MFQKGGGTVESGILIGKRSEHPVLIKRKKIIMEHELGESNWAKGVG